MMQNQQKIAENQKNVDENEEGTSYLVCHMCKTQEKVVDNANDLVDMLGLQQDQNQPKDLIQALLTQKCGSCDKFNCLKCLDECQNCSKKTCKLCLEYICDPSTNEQYYICCTCKFV